MSGVKRRSPGAQAPSRPTSRRSGSAPRRRRPPLPPLRTSLTVTEPQRTVEQQLRPLSSQHPSRFPSRRRPRSGAATTVAPAAEVPAQPTATPAAESAMSVSASPAAPTPTPSLPFDPKERKATTIPVQVDSRSRQRPRSC